MTCFLRNLFALLMGNLFLNLFGHVLALLFGHLVTFLLGNFVTSGFAHHVHNHTINGVFAFFSVLGGTLLVICCVAFLFVLGFIFGGICGFAFFCITVNNVFSKMCMF